MATATLCTAFPAGFGLLAVALALSAAPAAESPSGTPLAPFAPDEHTLLLYHFVDGVLQSRLEAAKDFSLGRPDLGLWVGSYVGRDFWFNGRLDELRISDCIRYDPEAVLTPGGQAFVVAAPRPAAVPGIRSPQRTGEAQLRVTLAKLAAGRAAGWIYLKAPARPAVIVATAATNAVSSPRPPTVTASMC